MSGISLCRALPKRLLVLCAQVPLALFSGAQAASLYVSTQHPMAAPEPAPRTMGLAGSTVALPNQEDAYENNPAATVFQPNLWSGALSGALGAGSRSFIPDTALGPQNSVSVGGAVRLLPQWTLSAGVRTESMELTRQATLRSYFGYSQKTLSIPVALAFAAHPRISVALGGRVVHETVRRTLGSKAWPLGSETQRKAFQGYTWSLSTLSAVTENVSLAALFQAESFLKEKVKAGSQSSLGVSGFRAALLSYRPALLRVGALWFLPEFWETQLSGQLDVLGRAQLAASSVVVHPGAMVHTPDPRSFEPENPAIARAGAEFVGQPRVVPRLAAEFTWLRMPQVSSTARLGSYVVPRVLKSDPKFTPHFAGGLDVAPWPSFWNLIAELAFDAAPGQASASLGLAWMSR